MASFEEQFYLENPSRWDIFKRDLRLLLYLIRPAVDWLVRGTLIRRALRRAKNSGQPMILEDVIDGPAE